MACFVPSYRLSKNSPQKNFFFTKKYSKLRSSSTTSRILYPLLLSAKGNYTISKGPRIFKVDSVFHTLPSLSNLYACKNHNPFSTLNLNSSFSSDANVYDVTIIGGGIIGNMIAYHLISESLQSKGSSLESNTNKLPMRICIVERDQTFRHSSTCLSAGGIRQQFGLKQNIAMSLYGYDFLENLNNPNDINHAAAYQYAEEKNENIDININYRGNGYLILASSKEGQDTLDVNHALQRSMGIDWIKLHSPGQLKQKFEWLNIGGLTGGSLGSGKEGFFDPYSLLSGIKKRNQILGIEFIDGSVNACRMNTGESNKIDHIEIQTKEEKAKKVTSNMYINAAGANAENIIKMCLKTKHYDEANNYPVKARKRHVFNVCTDVRDNIHPIPNTTTPLVIDSTGVYWRPEGAKGNFICGVSPESCNYEDLDYDWSDPEILNKIPVDWDIFDDVIVPAMYTRVPAFESIKILSAWTGFYEYNTIDQNSFLGYFGDDISNMILANGFSGHGLQQSPAAGKAIADLLLYNNSNRTIDVTPFNYDRVRNNVKIKEIGIY